MKKLLVAAVVCGAIGAFADEEDPLKAAQVYDLTVNVKTTVAKRAKLSPKKNPFVSVSDTVVYRAQGTQKWKGVIWGCDCESLAGKWHVVEDSSLSVAGCAIWNSASSGDILFTEDMNWRLLNAIDKKGDKCEGSWTIGDMNEDSSAFLCFAGFGTLAVKYTASACEDPSLSCGSYLKTMSGNVAGWMPAPSRTTEGRPGSCVFCGESDPGEEAVTDIATAWDFCPCEEFADPEFTAVSGTWTLKYNSKVSKRLTDNASIVDVYKFPASVKAIVERKIIEML